MPIIRALSALPPRNPKRLIQQHSLAAAGIKLISPNQVGDVTGRSNCSQVHRGSRWRPYRRTALSVGEHCHKPYRGYSGGRDLCPAAGSSIFRPMPKYRKTNSLSQVTSCPEKKYAFRAQTIPKANRGSGPVSWTRVHSVPVILPGVVDSLWWLSLHQKEPHSHAQSRRPSCARFGRLAPNPVPASIHSRSNPRCHRS